MYELLLYIMDAWKIIFRLMEFASNVCVCDFYVFWIWRFLFAHERNVVWDLSFLLREIVADLSFDNRIDLLVCFDFFLIVIHCWLKNLLIDYYLWTNLHRRNYMKILLYMKFYWKYFINILHWRQMVDRQLKLI